MMAAITAAKNGAKVMLLEKMNRAGKKMMITGKGRCNITSSDDKSEIIKNLVGNGKFIYSTLNAFDNQDVIDFFEAAGVRTKIERGNRVFPLSDSAVEVVDAMLRIIDELGILLKKATKVEKIITVDNKTISGVELASGEIIKATAVVIATGGASYPLTGSTGDGYNMARAVGHRITPIFPALVPLETEEQWTKDLQGLSLRNVTATIYNNGKKIAGEFGEMLFTHFGVTGPIILSLSRTASKLLNAGTDTLELIIDLKPALTSEILIARIERDFEKYKRKQLKNAMVDLLPERLIEIVLDYAYLDSEKIAGQVAGKEFIRLADTLKALPLTITRTRPLKEAIVTAGGVATDEINPKTMQSKLIKGLFFAGEVVDVDGYTGGYNLQAAFSTGYAAGVYSAKLANGELD